VSFAKISKHHPVIAGIAAVFFALWVFTSGRVRQVTFEQPKATSLKLHL